VRWYGLSYVAGLLIAWLILRWFAKSGRSLMPLQAVGDLVFYAIIGVMVGGRVGYALFYQPALLYTFTGSFPFWDLLAINKGGMASHGGMLGVLIAVWLFARRQNVSALHVMDVGALAATPGLFLGRIANFINGELWGKPVADQLSPPWWSVKYPQEMHLWTVDRLHHLRDVVSEVRVSPSEWDVALTCLAASPDAPPADALRLVRQVTNGLIEAVQAGNTTVVEAIRPMLTAYYPSQIFQAISDGPVLATILVLVWLRPRKPGVTAGTFLLSYGVLRIVTEIFRQPDADLVLGLSRGQALSMMMVIAGIVMVVLCTKRDAKPMGGLREVASNR
jgi:phosphatidylglycerol---prolipoprotein diacylglyceryl transferase